MYLLISYSMLFFIFVMMIGLMGRFCFVGNLVMVIVILLLLMVILLIFFFFIFFGIDESLLLIFDCLGNDKNGGMEGVCWNEVNLMICNIGGFNVIFFCEVVCWVLIVINVNFLCFEIVFVCVFLSFIFFFFFFVLMLMGVMLVFMKMYLMVVGVVMNNCFRC